MTAKLLRVAMPCIAIVLTACGDGGSSGTPAVTVYSISATAGSGGSIAPASATVNAGGMTSFTVTPNSGFAISNVTGCAGTLSGNTYTTGAVNVSCSVTANFVAQYTVTATSGSGGTIAPSTATVNAAAMATFTVTAKTGYFANSVTGCGGNLSGSTYTTGAISANCAVTANFAPGFTWVNGPANGPLNGVYGTKGVPASGNVPGARFGAVARANANGNVWLFGGNGTDYGSAPTTGLLNDLWEYSPIDGEWTWVGGSNIMNAAGVYGTEGTPAAANMPGARDNPVAWTDSSGNEWLFGGDGYDSAGQQGVLNDLWKYSPASGQWTWIGGSNTTNAVGQYGAQKVAAAGNMPGARNAAVSWTDSSGNLWLFGGYGVDSAGTQGYLNDLWEYSPDSGEWTWVGGSDTVNAIGSYGNQGVAASTNAPGARWSPTGWTDVNGDVWLFGGVGYGSTGSAGDLNDLWKYAPASGEWTWVGGSSVAGANGVYGTRGVAAAANVPGARRASVGWTDSSGNLWLFGGEEGDATTTTVSYLNDEWEYSPASGEWSWVDGSQSANALSAHGTEGVAAASNIPGARSRVAICKDPSNNIWLLGGYGYGFTNTVSELNDLWLYPTQ